MATVKPAAPYRLKLAPALTERTANKLEVLEVHPGVNVIVGPNGSGKSTILRGFHDKRLTPEAGVAFGMRYFDTEKMNPRVQSMLMEGDVGTFQMHSFFRSHGQTLKPVLLAWEQGIEKGQQVILIDEPEAGLDLDAKLEVLASYRAAPPRVRFLIATHEVLFVRAAEHVLELVPGYADKLRTAYAG